jgi:hypothetical protein
MMNMTMMTITMTTTYFSEDQHYFKLMYIILVRYLEGAGDLSSTTPFKAQVPYCATLKGGTTFVDLN